MNLGNSLFHARKKCGLSQEDVAAKLGNSGEDQLDKCMGKEISDSSEISNWSQYPKLCTPDWTYAGWVKTGISVYGTGCNVGS